MVINMTTQNYLIIENNIVTNVVVWDGGSDWTPPAESIQLIQATTPAMVWQLNNGVYSLVQIVGAGDIGFTWDGTVLTTNEPQPVVPPASAQPKTTGTTTA
jgi:hypothetical protein